MVILRSFLKKFSLRTGTTVSLVMSLLSLTFTIVLAALHSKDGSMILLETKTILLTLMWFSFTMLAFYGVYSEVSTFLIPDLSRRVLFLILDIMGVIANYFKAELENMPVPDIGLQWYAAVSTAADSTWYYVLVFLFIATIPVKAYFFLVMLSYYMIINMDDDTGEE